MLAIACCQGPTRKPCFMMCSASACNFKASTGLSLSGRGLSSLQTIPRGASSANVCPRLGDSAKPQPSPQPTTQRECSACSGFGTGRHSVFGQVQESLDNWIVDPLHLH